MSPSAGTTTPAETAACQFSPSLDSGFTLEVNTGSEVVICHLAAACNRHLSQRGASHLFSGVCTLANKRTG